MNNEQEFTEVNAKNDSGKKLPPVDHNGNGRKSTPGNSGFWGFRRKKLWDWMDLLLVPILLFIATAYLNLQANERQQSANQERERQEILQNYLSQMTRIISEQEQLSENDKKVIRVYSC